MKGFVQAPGLNLDPDANRLLIEDPAQAFFRDAVEQRDDEVIRFIAALLDLERLSNFEPHPIRIEDVLADDDDEMFCVLDGGVDFGCQFVAAPQSAVIGPNGKPL